MNRWTTGRLLVGIFLPMFLAPAARGDWSFVMLGDTRGPHDTTNGVSPWLNTIATKIAEVHPDLVLVSGDLVNGNDTNGVVSLSYAQQFTNWKAAMDPVTAASIAIYPVRGNHENSCDEGPPLLDLKQAYYDAFGASMPTNGPSSSNPTNDQRGFTYSFVHNNATFVVLDQYFYDNATAQPGYHRIDQTWLDQQLQQTDTPYKVVMGHVPVFMATGQESPEHFFGTDAAGYEARTNFWDSLGTNGARLYVAGHVHDLNVSLANDSAGNGIYQLVPGNGGAPLDLIGTNHDAGLDVQYTNDTRFGFALAIVGTNSMTIQYYLLNPSDTNWTTASYTTTLAVVVAPVPEPSAFLLFVAGVLGLVPLGVRRRGREGLRAPPGIWTGFTGFPAVRGGALGVEEGA